ncbi:MAG: tRNA dihydrouridine synthase DusB [bacterium]|nr:tRNA dihydrouridine synthase DusB [bacterium]
MKIGPIELDKPLALAPMEDVTDIPFRLICKEHGADLLYTEFVNCEALIRNVKKTFRKLQVNEGERPIAVQIYGGVAESLERAAAIVEEANPDFIDVNCGCWVRKIALREEGAGLLRNLEKFERVVKSVIAGTSLPVTVKTRLGWDEENIIILDVARMLEQLGVKALAVHCRTRCQGHGGEADWSWLEKLKNTVSIPIIGNGDVTEPEDVKRMFDTGCDGVMIGRGAIMNPWLFGQAKHHMATGEVPPPPTVAERVELCIRHLRLSAEHKGLPRGVIVFRKHYAGYLKNQPLVAKLRADLMQYEEVEPVVERLHRYLEEHAEYMAARSERSHAENT